MTWRPGVNVSGQPLSAVMATGHAAQKTVFQLSLPMVSLLVSLGIITVTLQKAECISQGAVIKQGPRLYLVEIN